MCHFRTIFTYTAFLFVLIACSEPEVPGSTGDDTEKPTAVPETPSTPLEEPSTYSPYNIRPAYDKADSCENQHFVYDDFKVNSIDIGQRSNANDKSAFFPPQDQDDNGVYMYNMYGKLVYHPVGMAQYCQQLINIYFRTNDRKCLEVLKAHAEKFIGIGVEIDGTILFPYVFDYNFNSRDLMKAPWYTAMAQGEILCVFSRLYELTGDKDYHETATKIFKSFSRFKGKYGQWVSCIDKHGNLWLEEYPSEQPSHVLNGMIFAIFGIYDYYLINRGENELKMLKAAITTIKKNMDHYRNEDNLSYYSMKYSVINPNYHPIHIKQLRLLHAISGIRDFEEMAELFEQDAANKVKAGTKAKLHKDSAL